MHPDLMKQFVSDRTTRLAAAATAERLARPARPKGTALSRVLEFLWGPQPALPRWDRQPGLSPARSAANADELACAC